MNKDRLHGFQFIFNDVKKKGNFIFQHWGIPFYVIGITSKYV